MESFDIIILGGGPAGSVTGRRLAQAGYSVLILEADAYQRPRVGETLSPSFHNVLNEIGLDPDYMNSHHRPSYAFASIWGNNEVNYANHVEGIYGQGWHVNRALFDRTLFEKAAAAGAICKMQCRVTKAAPTDTGQWQVNWIENGEKKTAMSDFLVNACGRSNQFSQRFGDKVIRYDELTAVGMVVDEHGFEEEVAMIESIPEGWWYSSPLPDGKAVVLLMTDFSQIKTGQFTQVEQWKSLASKSDKTAKRVDSIPEINSLFVRPAHSQRISSVSVKNYLPVGDALVSFDPLNGAGIMRSIQTAIGVSRVIVQHFSGDELAIPRFIDSLELLYEDYLMNRDSFYATESRWPEAPFWTKRMQAMAVD